MVQQKKQERGLAANEQPLAADSGRSFTEPDAELLITTTNDDQDMKIGSRAETEAALENKIANQNSRQLRD